MRERESVASVSVSPSAWLNCKEKKKRETDTLEITLCFIVLYCIVLHKLSIWSIENKNTAKN